jgi:hypothetical protein
MDFKMRGERIILVSIISVSEQLIWFWGDIRNYQISENELILEFYIVLADNA